MANHRHHQDQRAAHHGQQQAVVRHRPDEIRQPWSQWFGAEGGDEYWYRYTYTYDGRIVYQITRDRALVTTQNAHLAAVASAQWRQYQAQQQRAAQQQRRQQEEEARRREEEAARQRERERRHRHDHRHDRHAHHHSDRDGDRHRNHSRDGGGKATRQHRIDDELRAAVSLLALPSAPPVPPGATDVAPPPPMLVQLVGPAADPLMYSSGSASSGTAPTTPIMYGAHRQMLQLPAPRSGSGSGVFDDAGRLSYRRGAFQIEVLPAPGATVAVGAGGGGGGGERGRGVTFVLPDEEPERRRDGSLSPRTKVHGWLQRD